MSLPNLVERFIDAIATMPIISILRGVTPDEVVAVAQAIYDSGVRVIEVPLNSPDPFTSIKRLAAHFGDTAIVGAGTVLTVVDVERSKDAGAHAVKLFPGELISPAAVKAMRAVLPKDAIVLVVGGVSADHISGYRDAGVSGFGIGGGIYRVGYSAEQARTNAAAFVAAIS
jgi:2-dehydro-3-deoxyphosphogalactonate aldolase